MDSELNYKNAYLVKYGICTYPPPPPQPEYHPYNQLDGSLLLPFGTPLLSSPTLNNNNNTKQHQQQHQFFTSNEHDSSNDENNKNNNGDDDPSKIRFENQQYQQHDLTWEELYKIREPNSNSNNNTRSNSSSSSSYPLLPIDQFLLDQRLQPSLFISLIESEYHDRLLKDVLSDMYQKETASTFATVLKGVSDNIVYSTTGHRDDDGNDEHYHEVDSKNNNNNTKQFHTPKPPESSSAPAASTIIDRQTLTVPPMAAQVYSQSLFNLSQSLRRFHDYLYQIVLFYFARGGEEQCIACVCACLDEHFKKMTVGCTSTSTSTSSSSTMSKLTELDLLNLAEFVVPTGVTKFELSEKERTSPPPPLVQNETHFFPSSLTMLFATTLQQPTPAMNQNTQNSNSTNNNNNTQSATRTIPSFLEGMSPRNPLFLPLSLCYAVRKVFTHQLYNDKNYTAKSAAASAFVPTTTTSATTMGSNNKGTTTQKAATRLSKAQQLQQQQSLTSSSFTSQSTAVKALAKRISDIVDKTRKKVQQAATFPSLENTFSSTPPPSHQQRHDENNNGEIDDSSCYRLISVGQQQQQQNSSNNNNNANAMGASVVNNAPQIIVNQPSSSFSNSNNNNNILDFSSPLLQSIRHHHSVRIMKASSAAFSVNNNNNNKHNMSMMMMGFSGNSSTMNLNSLFGASTAVGGGGKSLRNNSNNLLLSQSVGSAFNQSSMMNMSAMNNNNNNNFNESAFLISSMMNFSVSNNNASTRKNSNNSRSSKSPSISSSNNVTTPLLSSNSSSSNNNNNSNQQRTSEGTTTTTTSASPSAPSSQPPIGMSWKAFQQQQQQLQQDAVTAEEVLKTSRTVEIERLSKIKADAMLEITECLCEMQPMIVSNGERDVFSLVVSHLVRRLESLVTQEPKRWDEKYVNHKTHSDSTQKLQHEFIQQQNGGGGGDRNNNSNNTQPQYDVEGAAKYVLRPYTLYSDNEFSNDSTNKNTNNTTTKSGTATLGDEEVSFTIQNRRQTLTTTASKEQNEKSKDNNNNDEKKRKKIAESPLELMHRTSLIQRTLMFSLIVDDVLRQVKIDKPTTPQEQYDFHWTLSSIRLALRTLMIEGDLEYCPQLKVFLHQQQQQQQQQQQSASPVSNSSPPWARATSSSISNQQQQQTSSSPNSIMTPVVSTSMIPFILHPENLPFYRTRTFHSSFWIHKKKIFSRELLLLLSDDCSATPGGQTTNSFASHMTDGGSHQSFYNKPLYFSPRAPSSSSGASSPRDRNHSHSQHHHSSHRTSPSVSPASRRLSRQNSSTNMMTGSSTRAGSKPYSRLGSRRGSFSSPSGGGGGLGSRKSSSLRRKNSGSKNKFQLQHRQQQQQFMSAILPMYHHFSSPSALMPMIGENDENYANVDENKEKEERERKLLQTAASASTLETFRNWESDDIKLFVSMIAPIVANMRKGRVLQQKHNDEDTDDNSDKPSTTTKKSAVLHRFANEARLFYKTNDHLVAKPRKMVLPHQHHRDQQHQNQHTGHRRCDTPTASLHIPDIDIMQSNYDENEDEIFDNYHDEDDDDDDDDETTHFDNRRRQNRRRSSRKNSLYNPNDDDDGVPEPRNRNDDHPSTVAEMMHSAQCARGLFTAFSLVVSSGNFGGIFRPLASSSSTHEENYRYRETVSNSDGGFPVFSSSQQPEQEQEYQEKEQQYQQPLTATDSFSATATITLSGISVIPTNHRSVSSPSVLFDFLAGVSEQCRKLSTTTMSSSDFIMKNSKNTGRRRSMMTMTSTATAAAFPLRTLEERWINRLHELIQLRWRRENEAVIMSSSGATTKRRKSSVSALVIATQQANNNNNNNNINRVLIGKEELLTLAKNVGMETAVNVTTTMNDDSNENNKKKANRPSTTIKSRQVEILTPESSTDFFGEATPTLTTPTTANDNDNDDNDEGNSRVLATKARRDQKEEKQKKNQAIADLRAALKKRYITIPGKR